MRVTVSVLGRFHLYELAKQLHTRGALAHLITSYPRFAVSPHGVPNEKTVSLPSAEFIRRATLKLGRTPHLFRQAQNIYSRYYDWVAARALTADQDIFVGWSSHSLSQLKRAREFGALTVVERHNAHIETQMQLMGQEYDRLGVPFVPQNPALLERELQEYEAADYISVPSEFVRRTFLEKGFSSSKILKVPLGASLARFYPGPKQDSLFRLVYCGGVTMRKGIPLLLQAFSELKLPNSELRLVGTIAPEIRPFLKRYNGTWLNVAGPQRGDALREQYNQGDVFVLPSIEDGFGMVVPEAMACGLPVICSRNSCGEDVVGEGKEGFLFTAGDVETLKERIVWMYEHPQERAEMGKRARARVQGAFTWDIYGDTMAQAYRNILAARAEARTRVWAK